jgi:hypothetical protein
MEGYFFKHINRPFGTEIRAAELLEGLRVVGLPIRTQLASLSGAWSV